MKHLKKEFLGEEEYDFTVLHGILEILEGKTTSDIILAWRTFLDQLPVEEAKKCTLLMKTEASRSNMAQI